MDFATVRNNLRNGLYATFDQFEVRSICLCLSSVSLYFREGACPEYDLCLFFFLCFVVTLCEFCLFWFWDV